MTTTPEPIFGPRRPRAAYAALTALDMFRHDNPGAAYVIAYEAPGWRALAARRAYLEADAANYHEYANAATALARC